MTPLNQTKDSILLDEFNDFFFDSKTMVQEANDILSEEVRTGRMISGEYTSDVWAFICDTRHTMVTVSFQEVSEPLSFFEKDNELFVSVIKCWIATLIPKYSIEM
ncbi:hypothetical protein [Paenisporosarcina sp. TG-14]|uniref:hypothetical protein n=1 Tax=Paenisporosarcina sp. TG-14 TaxID=1231057 RepID=UPI0002E151CB|nr:hypothetical protein [Paenisporosarcina sp. TG-14]